MNREAYQDYRLLQKNGIDVQKDSQIRFNYGSESLAHKLAKLIVGHIGREKGYQIGSEVDVDGGQIDVLLWGHPERLTYAVEVETDPMQTVMENKRTKYVRGPIDDMLSVSVTEMPTDYLEAQQYVRKELGL